MKDPPPPSRHTHKHTFTHLDTLIHTHCCVVVFFLLEVYVLVLGAVEHSGAVCCRKKASSLASASSNKPCHDVFMESAF